MLKVNWRPGPRIQAELLKNGYVTVLPFLVQGINVPNRSELKKTIEPYSWLHIITRYKYCFSQTQRFVFCRLGIYVSLYPTDNKFQVVSEPDTEYFNHENSPFPVNRT